MNTTDMKYDPLWYSAYIEIDHVKTNFLVIKSVNTTPPAELYCANNAAELLVQNFESNFIDYPEDRCNNM